MNLHDLLRRPPVVTLIGVAVGLGAAAWVAWAAIGTDHYFWPRWVWLGLGVILAIIFVINRVLRTPAGPRRWWILDVGLCSILTATDIVAWAFSGGGLFWPIWSMAGMAVLLLIHRRILRKLPEQSARALADRVDTLARTRTGALEGQAAELKRVERDLHDGVQARMVSLGMNLGQAESLITVNPARAAELLAEARATAVGALNDLRSVMHSIHPPVLADRGLADAIRALALDLSVPVEVTGSLPDGLAPATETAAYFATAESLANVVKHSQASQAEVRLSYDDTHLTIVVTDDGIGGADLANGTGMRGIASRLEGFDGSFAIDSPTGGPTNATITIPM
ncbi:sensor histidine kinase [Luteipulveratus mongoliensis]|uniref:histidine kinase n=1 Tax=Luteipulveratus mongoliensis TaxID=571913 RepID=A0A0K1JFC5_9MICO|nr:histidine kinase [Luteipulveratus mongoliensis]AKU15406.1 histidine kinase [Luteipulveratus mongoliensis]